MLVLTHKLGEYVEVGETKITVLEIRNGQVKLGYEAPPEVKIRRDKLIRKMAEEAAQQPPPTASMAKPPPEALAPEQRRTPWVLRLIKGGKTA